MKNRVRVERAKQEMTQAELAEKLGVSRQTVYAIESGKYVPSTLLALKMGQLFKIAVEELFVLEEGE